MPCRNHPEVEEGVAPCSRCGEEFCRDCVVELRDTLYCARCKAEQVKDILSGVDGTSLDLASVGRRFVAMFIDNLIMMIPTQIISSVLGVAMMTVVGMTDASPVFVFPLQLAIVLVAWTPALVYEGLMLQSRGQTLGKMAMSIKVVTPEGNNITRGQAWLRASMRLVLNFVSYANYLPAFFTREKRCIHDMAAGTRVVNWRP